jgi:hypothetical protein
MPLSLDDLITVAPSISKFDNIPLDEKLRSIEIPQNLYVKLKVNFVDNSGKPLDLSSISNLSNPILKMSEVTFLDKSVLTVNGTLSDPPTATALFVFDNNITKNTGLYYVDYFINDSSGNTVLFNRIFLSIIPTLINTSQVPFMLGPITSKELLLSLKNSSPNESTLLQQVEFDLSEIVYALRWPIDFWNTSVPDIGIYYTTANFPYRTQWIDAAIGELLSIAAHRYRRDRLPAQVGGIAIDEIEQKTQLYEQAAMLRKQTYMRFVRTRKGFLDMHGGFGARSGIRY